MSVYSFIAADYKLPETDNSKEKIITVEEAIKLGIKSHALVPWESMNLNDKVLIIENESDLGELVIRKDTSFQRNVSWYTDKPFIYLIEFRYTEYRAKQLLEYIKENTAPGHQLELWSIWLDDKQKIKPDFCNYDDFALYNIKQMYDFHDENYMNCSCFIINRTTKGH